MTLARTFLYYTGLEEQPRIRKQGNFIASSKKNLAVF